jgi:hypothetical protein
LKKKQLSFETVCNKIKSIGQDPDPEGLKSWIMKKIVHSTAYQKACRLTLIPLFQIHNQSHGYGIKRATTTPTSPLTDLCGEGGGGAFSSALKICLNQNMSISKARCKLHFH